jgi:hypothetical protein
MEKNNLSIQKANELSIDGEKLRKKKEKLQNPIYQQLLLNEQQILMYSRQINNLEYQNRLKIKGLTNVDMDIIRRNNQKTLKIKPLKEDLIECLPIKKANEKDCIQCIICTEKIKLNSNIIILNCPGKHKFHEICIKEWLRKSDRCPICRNENIL